MTSSISQKSRPHPHRRHPVFFEEFFDLGLEESKSPFLTPSSREWGHNLSLKASLFSALLLAIAFLLSFIPGMVPIAKLMLVVVYVVVGIPSLIESVDDLLDLEVNIDLLMTLAAFSSALIGSGFEGALLLVLFAISHAMEDAVTEKAKSAISSLTKLSPTTASFVTEEGVTVERSVKEIIRGDIILVKAGQIVPLDGVVIEGRSSLNLMHLTGENLPITKVPGDSVPSGAANIDGALTLKVTHSIAESTLSRIIALVTEAQKAKPKLQRWFDDLSRGYATAIIALSTLFAFAMPPLLGIPFFSYEGSLYRALAFLIAASPCALIIAIPIAYLSAISACARSGILLKGGVALDALASCKVFAFDKTGTLTTGELQVVAIECLTKEGSIDSETLLGYAHALERNAVHPIALAITNYAKERGIAPLPLNEFRAIPGSGLQAKASFDGKIVDLAIGNVAFIKEKIFGEEVIRLEDRCGEGKKGGQLVAAMVIDSSLFLFRFEDKTRPKVKKTLENLQTKGNIELLMLTGDHEESARKVAEEMGIKKYYSALRPDDKLRTVSAIAQEKGLAMVGDGINDAPALARATVGISMGKVGSSAAIDAADIVLLQDDIEKLDWLLNKARETKKIVVQNLLIAAVAIVGASLPALAGMVPLWLAVILHEGGTVVVGLNALRLIRKNGMD